MDAANTLSLILSWITRYEWFHSEFTRIGGLDLLEQQIPSNQHSFNYPEFILQFMTQAQSFKELVQWANCLRGCLTMPRNYDIPTPENSWIIISRALTSVLSAQSELRAPDPSTAVPSAQFGYIKALSNVEWNDWRDYMTMLIEGVLEGYIPDTDPCFLRDPDGICSRH
jgi:hypothetical protein